MAATLTPSRTSHFRASIAPAATTEQYAGGPSPTTTLPSIDFAFPALREEMALFTARFDAFITAGRARVLAERNAFRLSAAEVGEQARTATASLSRLAGESAAHESLLAREAEERAELSDAVSALGRERDAAAAERDRVLARIEGVRAAVAERRAQRSARVRAREVQVRLNAPELRFWERSLALRIEGVQQGKSTGGGRTKDALDRVRFVFGCVDSPRSGRQEREGGFVLDMAGGDFAVVETTPVLDEDGVQEIVQRFNGGGALAELLKGMRGLIIRAYAEK